MNEVYAISPRLAEQAAKDYLAIKKAGMLDEFEHEVQRTIEAHTGPVPDFAWSPRREVQAWHDRQLDQHRNGNGHRLAHANGVAADLAAMLNCPASAIEPFIVPELLDEPTRRTIVVDVLRNMANYARRQNSTARRRTA